MPYITIHVSDRTHQISFDDLMDGVVIKESFVPSYTKHSSSATRTWKSESIPTNVVRFFNIPGLINDLKHFTEKYESLINSDKKDLYHTFFIPKRDGKPRRIDDPQAELRVALYELKDLLEHRACALYHTAAFAYIPGRCCVSSIAKHQANVSHWFLKTDFSNFFGSTTPTFLMQQLSMIFPFSEIVKNQDGKRYLELAMSLCFLNNGLPQGTPTSPLLTNLMMIPIDYKLANTLRDHDNQHFVYTRYADDILISSREGFQSWKMVKYINNVLQEFNAPFKIKDEKTRYGSGNGSNFNLGVMLNKDNQITVSWGKKKELRAMIHDYVMSKKDGDPFSYHDVQVLNGVLAYCYNIEKQYWDHALASLKKKYGFDIKESIRADLSKV